MQTIIVLLNPGKLANPDADLRYFVPDRIDELSKGRMQDNGYDYLDAEDGQPGPLMGIWLKTESAGEGWPLIVKLFQEERLKDNDLSQSAELYISEEDSAPLEACTRVFPQ